MQFLVGRLEFYGFSEHALEIRINHSSSGKTASRLFSFFVSRGISNGGGDRMRAHPQQQQTASLSPCGLSARGEYGEDDMAARFTEGQDVLARWSDGLFYLGTITKIDRDKQRCFVVFEDRSKSWVLWNDIQTAYIYSLNNPERM
ncbi:hypothetical protein AMECASPLE_033292 [Ameca splendens]|uniref:Tudor domain-containing protein n=1 Tax=Ameca splendens TaxID=208324 RepID=A0ABV0XJR0_9TELE